MSAETDLLSQFNGYGNVITTFVVVQSLAFGYKLGTVDSMTLAIVKGRDTISPIICFAGLGYAISVVFCGYWELALRSDDNQSHLVLLAVKAAIFGRVIAVAAATAVAYYGLHVQPPYSEMEAKQHASAGHSSD